MNKEPIIITKEQENALNYYKSLSLQGNHLQMFVSQGAMFRKELKSLNELSTDTMARLLYEPNSYTVQQNPRFKEGTLVAYNGMALYTDTWHKEAQEYDLRSFDDKVKYARVPESRLDRLDKYHAVYASLGRVELIDHFVMKSDAVLLIIDGEVEYRSNLTDKTGFSKMDVVKWYDSHKLYGYIDEKASKIWLSPKYQYA